MSSILDPIYGGIILVVFAVVLLVVFTVYTSISGTGILGSYSVYFDGFWTALNNVAIFIVLGMAAATILSAFLIKEHPAFLIVTLVLLFIQMIIMGDVIPSFNMIASTPAMAAALTKFNLLVPLIENLPVITAITSAVAALVGLLRG